MSCPNLIAGNEPRRICSDTAGAGTRDPVEKRQSLTFDLRLVELRLQRERLLPAEVTGFSRNGGRYAFLHDVQLGAADYWLKGHRRLHLAGQVGVVKAVGVPDALIGHQLKILAAKRVRVAGSEVGERHFVGAADFSVEMVNLAGEAVGRQSFVYCVAIEEGPIDSLRRRAQHAMKA